MSRIVVCNRCSETAPLKGGFINDADIPEDWHELDWVSGAAVDLCPHCYHEFNTEFLGKN